MSRRSRRRMTLVELLVAVALGMILIGVVTFVWLQSNKIFTTTVHRLETYQRLRTVLDTVERDLANTARTINMEFFVDHKPNGETGNGYFDPDDAEHHVGTPPRHFRTPSDPRDPLVSKGEPEFAISDPVPSMQIEGFPPASATYLFAPTVISPPPYEIGAGYTDERFYWRDEVYVRSFAMVDGINRSALIHFRLVQLEDGRSALRRRIWYLNNENAIVPPTEPNSTDRVTLLGTGLADFKVAFYFKENTSEGDGHWYHVGKPRTGPAAGYFDLDDTSGQQRGSKLLEQDEVRGFRTARLERAAGGLNPNPFGGNQNAFSFVYQGNARIEERAFGPPVLRALKRLDGNTPITDLTTLPLRPGNKSDLEHYDQFDFPGVRPGDQFLLFDATDDDETQATGAPRVATSDIFPGKIFTVDTIFSESADVDFRALVAVKFREPFDFHRLKQQWLGDESPIVISPDDVGDEPEDPTYAAGPKEGRTITGSFNVRYRVGFLPAAFLIRISSDDRYNRKVLPMERVIRLVQQ